ncbi:MAG: alpha/beta hydrolase [Promethearchaeota archaeon]
MSKISKLREEYEAPHHLITTSDNKILFLRAWEPQTTPKEIAILIFHGITAYSGPYGMIAEPLSKEGYSVFGLDLRGHGLSDGNRGDYPSKQRLIKDFSETIAFLKQKFPILILFGHSLGVVSAIVAINHCLEDINGTILVSAARTARPGVYPPISTLNKLRILFNSLLFPSKPVVSYYREGMTGLNDPLFNFRYTLRFMKIFSAKGLQFPEKLDFPVFVSLGEHDELFTVEAAREFFNEIPSDNKEFYVVPGAKHAEFPEGSWKQLVTWLKTNFD